MAAVTVRWRVERVWPVWSSHFATHAEAMEKAQKSSWAISLSRCQREPQEQTFEVSLQSHRAKTREKNLGAHRDKAEWEPE